MYCSCTIKSGSPRLDSDRQADMDWSLRWPQGGGGQYPQVSLPAAAAGKDSVTYRDVVDFVTKDMIDELTVAGIHDGFQLVVETGSKAKYE